MNLEEIAKSKLTILREDPKIDQLLKTVDSLGSSLIFGGAVRDWSLGNVPRDIDLVVDCSNVDFRQLFQYPGRKNSFGGFKLVVGEVDFDIWNLDNTWAFKHNANFSKTLSSLTRTVFFNIDAVVYYLDQNKLVDDGLGQAMETKILDIVYEPNPHPFMCVGKAILTLKKYEMKASTTLQEYIEKQKSLGFNEKAFEKFQIIKYGDTLFDYQECMSLVC